MRRGPIVHVAQIVIIYHCGRKENRHQYHAPSQQSISVRAERIVTYTDVSARTKVSQLEDSCRNVRIRLGSNREFFKTYFIVSERAMRSLRITSPEIHICLP